ncbi:MAG: flagellin lysine-N-methylase [Capsulimonas sp.]|uniref:flagellin lysine-N-methylase n=1 Tax=Capsulimonas sp. TaxID=2494211 RepID=UPI0032676CC4
MLRPIKLLQPRYFADFRCIGSDCEDTCCAGMGVVIDKHTYGKYQACEHPKLKPIIETGIALNPASVNDATYAQVVVKDGHCPFLTDDRLCAIQQILGERALSRTCSMFPRAMSTVDGVIERSLYLSCPAAARAVLLNPEPMKFDKITEEQDERFTDFPVLNSADVTGSSKPYRYFWEVRQFVISLLQNRAYDVWERMVMLGLFCDQLNQLVVDQTTDGVPDLIQSYSGHIAQRLFDETLAGIGVHPALQFNFLAQSMEHRIFSDSVSHRFIDCYYECMQGVGYTPDTTIDEAASRYTDAYEQYYKPFMEQHEYIFENYLVNYVFKLLFPFGPQKSVYYEEKSVYSEFVLMAAHFAMLRSLLVGMSAYYQSSFGFPQIVKLFQSFAKAIEHDPAYLKRILHSLEENEMTEIAVMTALIKN